MEFESILTQAFAKSHVQAIVDVFATEKCFKSFAERLDKIVSKELDNKQFKNVMLVVKAIERVIEQDHECFHALVQQGVVIMAHCHLIFLCVFTYMVAWYERTVEHTTTDWSTDSVALLEAFFDMAVKLSHTVIEGKASVRTLLILRFGALVIDETACYKLRLDAIQTINSMVNGISKDERRDICLSTSLSQLLENFVDVLLKGGDYEFQVAITEALSRMTIRRTRDQVTRKWFGPGNLASSFMAIKFVEFETDCRTFLNELNESFGDKRRVFTFPCIRAFLDTTELFKPKDENLKEFWIDFNIGSSCITFSVHDPESSLWGSICLLKTSLDFYELHLMNDQRVLTVSSARPVLPYGKLSGHAVQLFFSACHEIAAAAEKVFGAPPESGPPAEANGTPPQPERCSSPNTLNEVSTEPSDALPSTTVSPTEAGQKVRHGGLSWDEVVGIASEERSPCSVSPPVRNYTRNKPKVKVLPLSSPSSGEEKHIKPVPEHVRTSTPQKSPVSTPSTSPYQTMQKDTSISDHGDSGFQEPPVFENTIPLTPPYSFPEKDISLGQESFQLGKRTHESLESSVTHRRKQAVAGLQLRDLFPSNPLEGAADGEDPDADVMGPDVMTAFQSFKTQLLDHVAVKYQRIETKSLQSLSACQNQVTTLLKNVHAQRIQLLERFEQVVVEQLGRLEQDCHSLRNIEQETMTFWRTEYQAVKSFCERQQSRLGSLGVCNGTPYSPGGGGLGQGEEKTMEYSG